MPIFEVLKHQCGKKDDDDRTKMRLFFLPVYYKDLTAKGEKSERLSTFRIDDVSTPKAVFC